MGCRIVRISNGDKNIKVGIIYSGSPMVLPFKDRLHALRYLKPRKSTHNSWWFFKSRGLDELIKNIKL